MKIIDGVFGKKSLLSLLVWLLLLPALSRAAVMNNYCATPPFILSSINPNLLLMIDNSASMYDLAYTDSSHTYCANATTNACTTDSQCSGAGQAYCVGSYATTPATTTKAICNTNADCSAILAGDTCVLTGPPSGRNLCRNATVTAPASISPIACTTNSGCTSSGGTCPAGTTCTWTTSDTCNNTCSATRQCYDTTYSGSTTYGGYFDHTATYSYNFTSGKFTSGASMPGTCTYSAGGTTQYLCVNTTGTGTAETIVTSAGGNGFVASGNFLNWLAASKFDQEKVVLTGGKFDATNSVLVAESRGCGGRQFLKQVSGVNLTFAIRGGTPGGIGSTQSLATEYGQTYIEIYTGIYNASACLSAMNDWISVVSSNPANLGSFQNDSKNCAGGSTTGSTLSPGSMWNHVLHNCYQGMTGGGGGYGTNMEPLEGDCKSVYASIAPSAITDNNSGYSYCSSVLAYNLGGTSYTGYLGTCWNGTDFTGPCTPNVLTQMQNFCQVNVNTNPVVDPSSTAVTGSIASASVPGFVMQQGLSNLTLAGTLTVKVGLATAPTGLIDQFKSQIRFGTMVFNNDGTKSECGTGNVPCSRYCSVTKTRLCYLDSDCPQSPTAETCPAYNSANNQDGGKIIAFVGAGNCSVTTGTACAVNSDCPAGEYCKASVGDHTVGLIKAIDDIKATTWTPHAEAFYNAIAYFVKDATATTPSLSATSLSPSFGPTTATTTAATPINTYLTGSDSYSNKNPITCRCQQNNILLLTDGASTADQNSTMTGKVTDGSNNFRDPGTITTDPSTCGNYKGSSFLHDLSYYAYHRNIFDPTKQCPPPRNCSVTTTTACNVDSDCAALSPTGQTCVAAYTCETAQTINTYAVYTGNTSTSTNLCDPYAQLNKTATDGGTTLYTAADSTELEASLKAAFQKVAAGSSSGTAASILSNSQGSGANLLQALFYPLKTFGTTDVTWIGEMQNLWYAVDPFLNSSTIREDTFHDYVLNLKQDYVLKFSTVNNQTMVTRWVDSNGDGVPDTVIDTISPDAVTSLWRAGALLQAMSADNRTIYTALNPSPSPPTSSVNNLITLDGTNTGDTTLQSYLQATGADATAIANDATAIVSYVRGHDSSTTRNRTVTNGSTTDVWKLGDIISSTPHMQTAIHLNDYDTAYGDTVYASFTASFDYKNRGMAYTGANDGMLHAFNLGKLTELHSDPYTKAKINNGICSVSTSIGCTGTSDCPAGETCVAPTVALGDEAWAYVPMNALPYLRYLQDPAYCHLYYVDAPPFLVDASIMKSSAATNSDSTCTDTNYWTCDRYTAYQSGNASLDLANTTWRTILIGGMGLGGASGTDVATPLSGVGYSSYFALDVTNPASPKLMWEFSNPALGYSTSGPAIIRVGSPLKNGRWFAVFASGPTGPVNTDNHQFMGQSTQSLKLFVVDLKTGTLARTIDLGSSSTDNPLGLDNSFAGSLLGSTLDTERWNAKNSGNSYTDNVAYFGYTQKDTSVTPNTWTKGGVLRLQTKELTSATNFGLDVSKWQVNKVISDIGPVTSAVAKLQAVNSAVPSQSALWLFFGTGRYFFKMGSILDDPGSTTDRQRLYGIKDPCYLPVPNHLDESVSLPTSCTTPLQVVNGVPSTLTDQSNASSTTVTNDGWYITLDPPSTTSSYLGERSITDPVAANNGLVYFTTFKPTADPCAFGGTSNLWVTQYNTGLAPAVAALQGEAVLQSSTGAFWESKLNSAFTQNNGRKSNDITGVPPKNQGLALMTLPKPVKKILQIQEK